MPGVGQLCTVVFNGLSVDFVRPPTIVSENADDLCNVLAQGRRVWLTIIPGIDRRQDVLVALTQLCQFPQQDASLGR